MKKLTPNQQLALNTQGNLALTANAGSGKTFVLARRYVNALIIDELEISSVAAITFTEKAASELYNRISGLIDDYIIGSYDKYERKKLEKIRRQLVSANISTIHSFCISILRDHPVESNLDARFIPIDEKLSQELIELSVEEIVRGSFDDKSSVEDVKILIRILGSKGRLMNQLVKLIQNRKNVKALQDRIYSLDESEIRAYLDKTFEEHFIRIWIHYKTDFIESLDQINTSVLNSDPENQEAVQLITLLETLNKSESSEEIILTISRVRELVFTANFTIKKRGYVSKEAFELLAEKIKVAEEIITDLKSFNITIDDSSNSNELIKFGKKLLIQFDKALKTYEQKKKAEGYIDYEDILLYVKQLLQNPSVQNKLAEKYKLIMVDEFQDTNEIQYQIFLPLLDYLKKGNLFIVGDEKQSIYKFRDAEISVFNLTRNNIKDISSTKNLLVLPDSFRMSPEICAFSNHIFRTIFKDPIELFGEVSAADLICARDEKIKGKIEFLINANSESELDEAELLVKKIKKIKAESAYSFSDMTILVRKRKHFDSLEKQLIKNQIPYSIVGGRGFYQRQSINDIFNYLTFLADKKNDAALVGILRSPFFNVSDSNLYKISLKNGRSFWQKLKNSSGEYEHIIKTLIENLSLCNSISFSQLIEKLITDNNYLSVLSSRIDGNQEIANVYKLINLARYFNATGFRNLYDFISYLKEAISETADESQAFSVNDTDTVKLMTIHQAKGLEFPIVFLFRTDETGMQTIVKTGDVIVDKDYGILTKLPKDEDYFDEYVTAPIVSLFNFLEEKKNYAELKRLLYVALTRAKDQLYITGTIKQEKAFNKNSFLSLLSKGLHTDFLHNGVSITEELKFLKIDNDAFTTISENVEFDIDFTKEIEDVDILQQDPENGNTKVKIYTGDLYSNEKWEIISASKVSIFSQCPQKYFLTYESGFAKLNSLQISTNNLSKLNYKFEDENKEELPEENTSGIDNSTIRYSDTALYGKLFHKVMEKNIRYDELEKYLEDHFKSIDSGKFKNSLQNDLKKLQESAFAREILSLPDYRNEFEVYINEQDYYLHGIIDRVIFDKKRLIICDYKTDNIEDKEIKKHSEYYLMQLKFYLYISSRLFSDFEIFEGILVFIKHPNHAVSIKYSKKELKNLEAEITKIIPSIRSKNFEKNLSHCRVCSFSDSENKCVIN